MPVIDRSILLLHTLSWLKYGASTLDLARVGVMHAFDHDAHMAMLGVDEVQVAFVVLHAVVAVGNGNSGQLRGNLLRFIK